ncbi:hypothetical protein SmJEL517_g01510 [Synchytrium microbalum]|uniref:FAS1 domain-containing protein n=1 Tax=Synchytrium microbalum TaxID=1806994 RepID=A0A507CA35_9FUNG|nr:uncharacterized protein SmJEL517_g01510 [Synchytrium microbalum]TPX36341.1 hypothetical protein SmJEL517_g01510 [Synchytrium microbalum]
MLYLPLVLALLAPLTTTALPKSNQVTFWVVGGAPSAFDKDAPHSRDQDEKTIAQTIADDEQFSQLHDLLKSTKGLKDDLSNPDRKYTLFAPTNEAFQSFNLSKDFKKKEFISYHITGDSVLKIQDLRDGQIFATQLKEKNLKNERQILRITKRDNEIYVNMMAHIISETAASNGNILVIDRVLMPPKDIMEAVISLPQVFSTLATAIFRTELQKELEESKAITVFAPDNRAWEEGLEFEDVYYLFSKEGKSDLKKLLKYHVVPSLEYSPKFRSEGKVDLKTLNGKHSISIQATQAWLASLMVIMDNSLSPLARINMVFIGDDGSIDNPENWDYDVNEGMAKIKFADGPAENGVVHVINKVLIPTNVQLPSKKVPSG